MNTFGRVDILVNNAGITRDNLILRMSEADFDAVLDANLKGAFLCCKEAARRMVRQRWGRIGNLSSVVALRGNAGQTNYSASKAGLIGLSKSLAKELDSRGVTVNEVAPGFIEKDMTAAMPQEAKDAMEQKKMIYAGKYNAPDYELILNVGCALAIESTMIHHNPEVQEKLEQFGIPVMVERSSYEADPLRRMEWITLYGELTG